MRRNEREISDIQEIEEIISKAETCRIAFADNNMPYIVALNFGYSKESGNKLFFHCAKEGKKLDMIRKNNFVCFQMDIEHQLYTGINGCDWGMKYRSVLGFGNISVVTGIKERKAGLDCIMSHYGGKNDYSYDDRVLNRTNVLCLEIKEMTGKKC
jgi:uncharacterized protein